jgi:hypothetical protein
VETGGRGVSRGQQLNGRIAYKTVALPAIVDLDALDTVRDRLIDAVELGPVAVSGKAVERVSDQCPGSCSSAPKQRGATILRFHVADASG